MARKLFQKSHWTRDPRSRIHAAWRFIAENRGKGHTFRHVRRKFGLSRDETLYLIWLHRLALEEGIPFTGRFLTDFNRANKPGRYNNRDEKALKDEQVRFGEPGLDYLTATEREARDSAVRAITDF